MRIRRITRYLAVVFAFASFALIAGSSSRAHAEIQNNHTVDCNDSTYWGFSGGDESEPAGLVINAYKGGVLSNGAHVRITSVSNSIGNLGDLDDTTHTDDDLGQQCGGRIIYGNGTSHSGGNGTIFDCKYNNVAVTFTMTVTTSLKGGHWAGNPGSFTLENGTNQVITLTWVPNPPQTAVVRGYKVDTSGNPLAAVQTAGVGLTGYAAIYNNPFTWASVSPGVRTLNALAQNGYHVIDSQIYCYNSSGILYLCRHTAGVSTPVDHVAFGVKPGQTYEIRFVYQIDDISACASPRTANPTSVIAGSTFSWNVAYRNAGTHTWPQTSYQLAAYFQDKATDSAHQPSGVVTNLSPMNYRKFDTLTVATGQTAYWDQTSTPENTPDFVAPATPGDYWVNVEMYNGTSQWGVVCSYPVTVTRVYDYVPRITTDSAAVPNLPATGAFVQPNTDIMLHSDIYNNQTAVANAVGDDYTAQVKMYSGTYLAGSGSAVMSPIDVGLSSSSGPGLVSGTTAPQPDATFHVPAGTPDGTQYCFFSQVTPGSHPDLTDSDPTVASRYSNFADPTTPDDNTNLRSTYAPGNIHSNDLCVEVESVRSADLQVLQGDVHAGGSIGIAGSCPAPAAGSGNITGSGSASSFAEYVTSSYGNVTGFGSGNSAGSALTLSNLAQQGRYGYICRPDLAAVAAAYPSKTTLTNGVAPMSSNSISPSNLTHTGVYYHSGPLTISAGTVPTGVRATIYNVNGSVTINGNILLSHNPTTLAGIPSFGLITGGGGNILISKDVDTIQGFLIATNTSETNGYIDTCYQHDSPAPLSPTNPSHLTGDCPTPLNVLGSLTGHNIYFWRTGATGQYQSSSIVTETVTQSGILYLAPPPAFETQDNSPYALPIYGGETNPLY